MIQGIEGVGGRCWGGVGFVTDKQLYHETSRGPLVKEMLTLLLLNTKCPVSANSVDPDQLASEEAN